MICYNIAKEEHFVLCFRGKRSYFSRKTAWHSRKYIERCDFMKKWLAFFISLCLLVSMVACKGSEFDETKPSFDARIITVYENQFLVESDKVGLCYVRFDSDISLEEYQRGDYIRVAYNGSVAESYPGQVGGLGVRPLTDSEMKDYYKETTLHGIYKGVSNGMILFHTKERRYCFAKDALDTLPTLTDGDRITVVYDGIELVSEYGMEICFPVSVDLVEVVEEE